MKNKIITNTITVLVCLMILMTSLVLIGKAVSPNNTDTTFSYTLNGGDNFKTGSRTKTDSSSCYMYCQSATGSYNAKVYGGYAGSCAFDCSNGFVYKFYQGYKRFMYNYVYENGYTKAQIYATTYNNGTIASGLWSPDSIYESGVRPASDYIH